MRSGFREYEVNKFSVILPAAGRRTQIFHLMFTEPGMDQKVHPCIPSFQNHLSQVQEGVGDAGSVLGRHLEEGNTTALRQTLTLLTAKIANLVTYLLSFSPPFTSPLVCRTQPRNKRYFLCHVQLCFVIYFLAKIDEDGQSLLLENVVATHILVARVGGERLRAHDVKQPESFVEFRPVAPR